jgi:hypothetical protein
MKKTNRRQNIIFKHLFPDFKNEIIQKNHTSNQNSTNISLIFDNFQLGQNPQMFAMIVGGLVTLLMKKSTKLKDLHEYTTQGISISSKFLLIQFLYQSLKKEKKIKRTNLVGITLISFLNFYNLSSKSDLLSKISMISSFILFLLSLKNIEMENYENEKLEHQEMKLSLFFVLTIQMNVIC